MPPVPKYLGTIQIQVHKILKVTQEYASATPQSSWSRQQEPLKFGAMKKEATTYLSKTIMPEKAINYGLLTYWYPGEVLWKFTAVYRGEAWAIVGKFLPSKYGDDDAEESTHYDQPPAKRQKTEETEEDKLIREAMSTLSYTSSCEEFFSKMVELLDRDEEEFDDILDVLESERVNDVAALVKVSDAQFLTTHLPANLAVSVKRNISNLIRQYLEPIPKPVIRITLD
jgi:hypothetical protein